MNSRKFSGVGTALVTPFAADGTVDLAAMRMLVERQITGGIDMLVPCGTTGEAVTLSDAEYESVVSTVVETAAGRVPVIAGAGSNSTARTIELALIARSAGADALLVVGPYYNKPTQEGFVQHYRAVTEAVQHPVVLYNVPGRTGSNMTAATQLRIAAMDWMVATKEASANFSQLMEIVQSKPVSFSVLSGDDNLVLAQTAVGIDGVISVVSNEVPGEFSVMVHAALDGDLARARTLHYRLLELMDVNFIESNPIPVKTALAMMGLIVEQFRLPLVPMGGGTKEKLRIALDRLGLLA